MASLDDELEWLNQFDSSWEPWVGSDVSLQVGMNFNADTFGDSLSYDHHSKLPDDVDEAAVIVDTPLAYFDPDHLHEHCLPLALSPTAYLLLWRTNHIPRHKASQFEWGNRPRSPQRDLEQQTQKKLTRNQQRPTIQHGFFVNFAIDNRHVRHYKKRNISQLRRQQIREID